MAPTPRTVVRRVVGVAVILVALVVILIGVAGVVDVVQHGWAAAAGLLVVFPVAVLLLGIGRFLLRRAARDHPPGTIGTASTDPPLTDAGSLTTAASRPSQQPPGHSELPAPAESENGPGQAEHQPSEADLSGPPSRFVDRSVRYTQPFAQFPAVRALVAVALLAALVAPIVLIPGSSGDGAVGLLYILPALPLFYLLGIALFLPYRIRIRDGVLTLGVVGVPKFGRLWRSYSVDLSAVNRWTIESPPQLRPHLPSRTGMAQARARQVRNANSMCGPSTRWVLTVYAPGIAITVSTGDGGYGVESPASFTSVIAVGGTSLHKGGSARGWTESAWSGAGSGCSTLNAKPAWQTAATTCSGKASADVSAVADPNTGVAIYDSTPYQGGVGWQVYGGTSASSPIIASVYALGGNTSGYPASYTWAHTGSLNDVTSGSNGSCSPSVLCTAGTGWDGPTGLGTPDGPGAF